MQMAVLEQTTLPDGATTRIVLQLNEKSFHVVGYRLREVPDASYPGAYRCQLDLVRKDP